MGVHAAAAQHLVVSVGNDKSFDHCVFLRLGVMLVVLQLERYPWTARYVNLSASSGAAEDEPGEEIPEVMTVGRKAGQRSDPHGGSKQPGGKRCSDAETTDDNLGDVRRHDDRAREGHERGAALHRGVVENVFKVEASAGRTRRTRPRPRWPSLRSRL